MRIPLMNVGLQYQQLKKAIDEAMMDVARNSRFILDKETAGFESDMARYCKVKHAVGVASGTDAIILTLTSLGITEGDEVITTPMTFMATAEAISRVGARPVFADIDSKTYNIDPSKIEKAVTKKTKAVIPVHFYGNPCDMGSIMKIVRAYKLYLIEDAAQAIGATYDGRHVGTFGDAGAFSFYPGKNLGAFGDGGMVVTASDEMAKKLRMLRTHGSSARYVHPLIGYNSRLDNLQAAVLSIKLKKLDEWTAKRRLLAEKYNAALKGLVGVPIERRRARHVYHLYVIRVTGRRDRLLLFLNDNGVESRVYYPVPLHLQECYRGLGYKSGDFPESEKTAKEVIALPLFPGMTEKQQDYVIEMVKKGIRKFVKGGQMRT